MILLTFPKNWKATLISILKIDNDPKNIKSYKPISMTNCYCKVLSWQLENKNLIPTNQTGFRKNRSTLDNLSFFESEVMTAFAKKSNNNSIFIDLESAYEVL